MFGTKNGKCNLVCAFLYEIRVINILDVRIACVMSMYL